MLIATKDEWIGCRLLQENVLKGISAQNERRLDALLPSATVAGKFSFLPFPRLRGRNNFSSTCDDGAFTLEWKTFRLNRDELFSFPPSMGFNYF
jgi:hypothetical protein